MWMYAAWKIHMFSLLDGSFGYIAGFIVLMHATSCMRMKNCLRKALLMVGVNITGTGITAVYAGIY